MDCQTKDRCDFRELLDPVAPEPFPIQSALPREEVVAISPLPVLPPTPAPPVSRPAPPPLMVVIQGKAFEVTGETLLGRQGAVAVEIFRGYTDVARRHCTLKPSEAGWELTVDSATSPTSLDGRVIPSGQSVPLTEGRHYLLLGEILPLELHLTAAVTMPQQMTTPPPAAPPAAREGFLGELQKFLRTES